MPRVYLDKFAGPPLFSAEQGVGFGMKNEPLDVMLVQFLLRAVCTSGKRWLGSDVFFNPPPGSPLVPSGSWDEPSRRYLRQWEQLTLAAKATWGSSETLYPDKVVPFSLGGKKIVTMNAQSREFFGEEAHAKLTLPGDAAPDALLAMLFYDPVGWRPGK